jgi:hypothetical protein
MPIEIRELLIKVTIEEHVRKPGPDPREWQELKNKIVRECMDKLLVKLTNPPER